MEMRTLAVDGKSRGRFRTAAMQFNVGFLNGGFKLATGDPGFPLKGIPDLKRGGKAGLYEPVTIDCTFFDPNKYRIGLGYLGVGPFQVGLNHESIRHQIQNVWTHDTINPPSPWFLYMPSYPQLYFGINTGTSTQW